MTKMTYGEQLKHPNWQRRRLEIMKGADFRCERCSDGDTTLNVHHRLYVKGRMVWDYEDHELQCLCQACHQEVHQEREVMDRFLSIGLDRTTYALAITAGFLDANMDLDFEEEASARSASLECFLAGALAAACFHFGIKAAAELLLEHIDTNKMNPAQHHLLLEASKFTRAVTHDA